MTRCDQCGGEMTVGSWPFCPDHGPASVSIQPDEWPGGKTIENMGPTPMTFRSRSEWRRAMKERGLVNAVRHVGAPGSDKSRHTSRWV